MKKSGLPVQIGIFLFLLMFALAARAQIFTNLYNFTGNTGDGGNPNGILTDGNGTFFGATAQGGSAGKGTVFSISTNGNSFVILHHFTDQPDGSWPNELVLGGSTLYGTTYLGGSVNGYGTIFKVDTNGANYSILHTFTNSPDAQSPQTGLILNGATLYGVSFSGGISNSGAIFKIDTNGANYSILHSFNTSPDGAGPRGKLLLIGATLYGTTASGGSNNVGTIFKLNTNGLGYSVIYHFTNGTSPYAPYAALISGGNNLLYGVSTLGGSSSVFGAAFQIATNGANFAVLHSFNNNDGLSPQGPLLLTNNLLYGTTLGGGPGFGGTVFEMATNGANFLTLQTFTNAATGANPKGQLIPYGNSFYGITYGGGPGGAGGIFNLQLAPAITSQPQSLIVTNGDVANFNVSAVDDTAITYQWYFNNTLLAGQINNNLSFTATNGSAGNYAVVVSDFTGSITSSPATLTVAGAPMITSQPQSLLVTNGDPATFSVSATASLPISYQWYFNTNTLMVDQTNGSLVIPIVTTNNAGSYTVVVSDNFGAVTSSAAILTVGANSKPFIVTPPHNLIITNGNNATFTVSATGVSPLSYQWYSNSVNTAIGTAINGKTGVILTFLNVRTNFNGSYFSVVVTNTLGKATSSPALLTVVLAPLIVTNPQSVSVDIGSPVSFSVAALGTGLHFQWYSNSVNTAIGAALFQETNSTYNFTAIANANNRYYSVVVTNTFGKATSSPALLTVGSSPTITLQPVNASITNGDTVSFVSAATGVGTLGYQWLFNTNTLIPGANSTNLIITSANQPGAYSMKVTNSSGAATSSPAILTVVGKPLMLSSAFDPASGSYSFSYLYLAGSTNRLLVTSNLLGTWQAIATNIMATNGVWNFTDANSAKTNTVRFYRFISP